MLICFASQFCKLHNVQCTCQVGVCARILPKSMQQSQQKDNIWPAPPQHTLSQDETFLGASFSHGCCPCPQTLPLTAQCLRPRSTAPSVKSCLTSQVGRNVVGDGGENKIVKSFSSNLLCGGSSVSVLDSIFHGSQLLLPLVNDEWYEQCTQQHQWGKGVFGIIKRDYFVSLCCICM